MNLMQTNVLVLAYLGDAVYELEMRKHFIQSISNVNDLQKEMVRVVSAKGQALLLDKMLNNEFLTEEEYDWVRRGRNAKVTSRPKNTDIITYKHATAFETLIGFLYLSGKTNRLHEILEFVKEEMK